MPRLSLAFFTVAALCGLGGMSFGAWMGAHQDFTLSPAHAHLNLVGWATLALMGTFYGLAGGGGRLGWLNFVVSTVGAAIMIPCLFIMLAGNPAMEKGVIAGSSIVILGMLTFVIAVLSHWRRPKAG